MDYKDYSTSELIKRIRDLEKDKAEDLKKRDELVRSQYSKTGYLGPWHWDPKDDVLKLNGVQQEMFITDDAPETLTFDYYLSLIHKEDRESVKKEFDAYLKGEVSAVESEYRLLFNDGEYHWIYHRAEIDEVDDENVPEKIIGSISDISNEREYEEQTNAEKERLEKKASQDFLTNLLNRRGLHEHMNNYMKKSIDKGKLAIAMFDIDNFKRANDTFGHVYGDQVLREISELLEENTRDTDIVSRFGGDEFIVIFTKTSVDTAYDVCERIRHTVENRYQEEEVGITLSGGLKEYENENRQELVTKVDKLLYRAKKDGKNKIVKG